MNLLCDEINCKNLAIVSLVGLFLDAAIYIVSAYGSLRPLGVGGYTQYGYHTKGRPTETVVSWRLYPARDIIPRVTESCRLYPARDIPRVTVL